MLRNYVVFRRWALNSRHDQWQQFTAQVASSQKAAIEQARVGNEDDQADYFAIPTSVWKVVRYP